jgi:hypothetical protein
MSPTDLDEEIRDAIREALGDAEEPSEPPDRGLPVRSRRRWWAAPDWWLRTAASAAVGKVVGAVLTGVALLLAWLAAKAAGWIS